ncbi:hypothetical protein UACE39S_03832 [Ureibacillus acetophenoni]
MHFKGQDIQLTVGGAIYPNDTLDFDELFKIVNTNLYKSKSSGGNTITFYTHREVLFIEFLFFWWK